MKPLKWIAYLILLSFIISGCTFQKRTYRKGYYLHWKVSNSEVAEVKAQKETKVPPYIKDGPRPANEVSSLLASSENIIVIPKKNNSLNFEFRDNDCGDSLILRSGTASKVQIMEVTEDEVFYKRCANLNGPLIKVYKNDVARIRYVNGNVVTFEYIKKNDLKKIIKGEDKFAPDTTSVVSLVFSFLFLAAWFLMMIGIITKLPLVFLIGFILAVILFFLTFFTALYAFYQIKTNPEKHTGRSKAGMALFILLFGALVAAVPLILIYMDKLVI